MLNELRELSICLEKAGINPPDYHPKFTLCPRRTACSVYLDKDGNISGISSMAIDQVQTVRKWDGIGSYGVSFPSVNLPPLLKVTDDECKKRLITMKKSSNMPRNEIQKIVTCSTNLWLDNLGKKTNAFDKINECLDKPVNDLFAKLTDVPDEFSSITELLARAKKIDSKRFHGQLYGELLKNIEEGKSWPIDVLFYYSGAKPLDFQIIFEISDWKQFPANHLEVQKWMNSKLLSATITKVSAGVDAFGCNASGDDNKFPDVGFKNALGNVKLRAMTKDSPCQMRYGMIEHESFSVGNDVRKKMKRALEWLGDDDRKGKTWCDLSRRMERPMLLFAYPTQNPDSLPDLAGIMGDAEDDLAEIGQARFAALAERVTVALRGRTNETVDSGVRVFVLAKRPGDARTKVLASKRYSADHVIHSAQLWQEGSRNGPTIKLRSFGKNKGDTPVWIETLIPFPAEVVWCLNTVWSRQGTRAEGAHGFSVNDALSLLLGEGQELHQVATRALSAVLRNSFPLLMALGQANVQGLVHMIDKKYTKKYEKQKLLIPSIISLILHKLGHTKGEIMTSSAFLVGRLLNLADSLHLEYCKGPRKGSVPPQLVGNALMATALETPEKALSMLSQRVLPYQAWARTVKEGDRVGLVKTFLKQLGEVSEQLKEAPLPQRSSDTDKAQMLLGYLARVESEKN
ncbi:MAG: hypothetical protein GW861_07900 [Deltaproteobacteria bacterium]|nr:hypothetical protein [Deltaproteobacteria bacterium]